METLKRTGRFLQKHVPWIWFRAFLQVAKNGNYFHWKFFVAWCISGFCLKPRWSERVKFTASYSISWNNQQKQWTMIKSKNKKTKNDLKKKKQNLDLLESKKKLKPALQKQPRGQRVLVDCRPLQGLVHLHVVQSLLSLPSAPPRHL